MEKLYSVLVSHARFELGDVFYPSECVEIQKLPLKNAVSFAARIFESAFCNCYVFDFEKSEVIAYMIHFDKNPF